MSPFQYSLNLLRFSLEKLPPGFPEERKKFFQERYKIFKERAQKGKLKVQDVDEVLSILGEEKWPYRKAWEKFYQRYYKEKSRQMILNHLTPKLKQKYEQFIKAGGNLEDYRKGSFLETYFTPEEKLQLEQALIETNQKISALLETVLQNRSQEQQKYFNLVKKYQKEQEKILDIVKQLEQLAKNVPSLAQEIRSEIKAIREGFSIAEKDINLKQAQKILDFFKGKAFS